MNYKRELGGHLCVQL